MISRDDSEEAQKAKERAAGPLGDELSKFPLRFAASVLIPPTRRRLPFTPTNGTVTLLRLDERPLGVTCSHVLEGFRSKRSSDEPGFWIGNIQVDPMERLISEDRSLDLAVLDLSGLDVSEINEGDEIATSFIEPPRWPPQLPKAGEFVAFGGYPGVWRDHPQPDEVVFNSFSLGASEVTAAGHSYVACHFNREYWVSSRGTHGFDLRELGGMSGGPAFIWRGLHAEFFGTIYEYSAALDLLYIRSAAVITEDGSIFG